MRTATFDGDSDGTFSRCPPVLGELLKATFDGKSDGFMLGNELGLSDGKVDGDSLGEPLGRNAWTVSQTASYWVLQLVMRTATSMAYSDGNFSRCSAWRTRRQI